MNWRENVCRKEPHNCRKQGEGECRESEECCWQRDDPSGEQGNQGHCVAKGSCDYRTGIPTNKAKIPCQVSEGFSYNERESKKGFDFKWAFFTMCLIAAILLGGLIFIGIKILNGKNAV